MATDYRNLKWGSDAPTQVIWKVDTTSYWPGIIKWGSDVVWARALDVNKDTTTGISSFAVTLTSSIVPSSVTRGTNYYFGDVIKCDATYASYWTGAASGTKALSECFNLSTSSTPSTFYVRSLFQPTRTGTRTITVTGDKHMTVTASYTKTDGTSETITGKSAIVGSGSAWQGSTVTITATPNMYYTVNTSSNIGNHNPGTTNISASATSKEKKRAISTVITGGLSLTATYYTSASSSTSKTVTSSTLLTNSSFSGADISWAATAAQYWTLSTATSGNVSKADNTNDVIILASAARNMRKIIIANPDSRVLMTLTYTDASGNPQSASMATSTQTSYTSPDTWCGAVVSYARVTGSDPTEGVWFSNGALSGNIPANDTTSPYTLDMSLKTFNLRTYPSGQITYYTNSSMTTAVTQSKYSGALYYKYTTNNGFYILNGSTYTTTVSGTVPTSSAYVSGNTWGPFTRDPQLYSRVDFHMLHRGNAYYRQSNVSTAPWIKVASNTPGEAHNYVYIEKGMMIDTYASYVATAGSTTGETTDTYGTPADTYTSPSSCRTLSLSTLTGATTITFSGTLTARNVSIDLIKAAHKTSATVTYRDLTNTIQTVTPDATYRTHSLSDVWRGATVTFSASGTFTPSTGWTHNYNISYEPDATSIAYTPVATYNYATYTSTSGAGTSLSATLKVNSITTPSVMAIGTHGSTTRIVTIASTATNGSSGAFKTARLAVTATRSSTTTTISAALTSKSSDSNYLNVYGCQTVIAPPAMRWERGQTTIYVYNPNNLAFKFTGTVRYRNSQTVTFATSVSIAGCTSASYGLAMTGAAATGSLTSTATTTWTSSNSTL